MSVIVRQYFPSNPALSEAAMLDGFKQGSAILTSLRTVAFALTLGRDKLLYLSTSATELYGEPVKLLLEHPNFWLEAIHPDDKAAVWMGLDKLREQGHEQIEFTYRLVSSDGDMHWVRQQCRLALNDAGVPLRIDCLVTPSLPPAPAPARNEVGNAVFVAAADALLVRDAATLDILEANSATLALLACGRAELLRQRLADFSARTEGFDAKAEASYLDAARRGQVQRYDWLVSPREGGPRWVEAVTSPIRHAGRDCLLTALRDVDVQRRAQQQQGLNEELIERSSDAIAWADTAGQLQRINPAGLALLGIQADGVSDLFLTDLLPAWAQPHFLQTCLPLATREGRWHGEMALLSRDGRNLPVMLTLLAHKQGGALRGYSLIGQDIAPAKLREQRYKQEKENLEEDKLFQAKLLENISAGLVQPLAQLAQLAKLLEKHPEEVTRALPHLKRTVEQARRLVDASAEFILAGAQRDLPPRD